MQKLLKFKQKLLNYLLKLIFFNFAIDENRMQ